MPALPPPIPGRECGECTVCCINLAIDDPELHKPDEVVCPHLSPTARCTIYERRPKTCRNWLCGWRLVPLSDAMRPDRSRILLMPEMGTVSGSQKGGLRIVFLDDVIPTVLNDEILNLAGRMVAGGIPLFLSYGSGSSGKRIMVNEQLKVAAAAGDKRKFTKIIIDTIKEMADLVRSEPKSR